MESFFGTLKMESLHHYRFAFHHARACDEEEVVGGGVLSGEECGEHGVKVKMSREGAKLQRSYCILKIIVGSRVSSKR